MKKSSLKLYFATFLLTLALSSFGFAGNSHCPIDGTPPPPDEDGRNANPVINTVNSSEGTSSQFLQGFWEFLTQSTDLF